MKILSVLYAEINNDGIYGMSKYISKNLKFDVSKRVFSKKEAKDFIKFYGPDIVIIDTKEPVEKNYIFIKKMYEKYKKTRIIMYTDSYENEIIEKCVEAGVSAYVIRKPKANHLMKVIEEVAEGKLNFEDIKRETTDELEDDIYFTEYKVSEEDIFGNVKSLSETKVPLNSKIIKKDDFCDLFIVEDNAIALEGLLMFISKIPFLRVIGTAQDGEKALEKLKTLRPDIIITDIMHPNIDGLKMSKIIIKNNPDAKIIIHSADCNEETLFQIAECGAIGFIPKPINFEEFSEKILFIINQDNYSIYNPFNLSNDILKFRKKY